MHRGEPGTEPVDREHGVDDKSLQPSSRDVTQFLDTYPKLVHSEDLTNISMNYELGADYVTGRMPGPENHVGHQEVLPKDVNKSVHSCVEKFIQKHEDKSSHQIPEDLPDENGEIGGVVSSVLVSEKMKPTRKTAEKSSLNKSSGLHHEIVMGLPSSKQFETFYTRKSTKNSGSLGGGGKRNSLFSNKKYTLRTSLSCEKVLRPGSHEKSKEIASLADANSETVVRKGKKTRRKKGERREDDEYSRVKRNLRYLLKRIAYEQSLITAYSSEGWKGLSLEKLKPEKELERATKEILQRKLRIRDLFHHLDTLSAEGSLPQSLFDSKGEIASEDIFCAKCGSKDFSADNDIILCDGVCDRGFHQRCLEPPLQKEDIPPGDEGWLCPGCDCRLDCINLLNESQGTRLSLSDNWEKIFPEAAAAATGGDQDPNFDLPSDDSDDDDYDPNALADNKHDDDQNDDDAGDDDDDNGDKESQEDGSSDESDFTSASDEMLGASKVEQYMGLPSDDSEDEDYDPDSQCHDDEDVKQQTLGSDFTSDSEDLSSVLKDNGSYPKDEVKTPGESSIKKSQIHQNQKQPVTISESYVGQDGSADVPQRRSVRRLDYKKLYDEAYGNVPSSSSDDEDWDKIASAKEEDYISTDDNEKHIKPIDRQSSEVEEERAPRKPGQKSKRAKNKNSAKSQEGGEENGSPDVNTSSSARRQKDVKAQRLYQIFQENRYPDNTTKENLSRELGMTVKQVNAWFRNRRSYSNRNLVRSVSKKDVKKLAESKKRQVEASSTGNSHHVSENEQLGDHSSRTQNSRASGPQKRRRKN